MVFGLERVRKPLATPFPHVVIDEALPMERFEALRAEFPQPADFQRSLTIMGGRQNLIRGNPQFPLFMARNPAWRQLLADVNSPEFVAEVVRLFADVLPSPAGQLHSWEFEDYVEDAGPNSTGEQANSLPGQRSEVAPRTSTGDHAAGSPRRYYVTFDIARATTGYERGPHLDARYKLASLLFFLNSPSEYDGVGAQFGLHRLATNAKVGATRVPESKDVVDDAWVAPRANRAVIFLNSPQAIHSVSRLEASNGHRQFLYVGIAARHVEDLWERV